MTQSVREVAVVGIPDDTFGEVIGAVVVLRDQVRTFSRFHFILFETVSKLEEYFSPGSLQ